MFNISNYPIVLCFILIIIFFAVLMFFFRSKYTSILDPLVYHLLWGSTILTFPLVYIYVNGFDIVSVYFYMVMIFYFVLLRLFSKPIEEASLHRFYSFKKYFSVNRCFTLFILLFILFLFSKKSMFIYMLDNPISSWPLYRYTDLQGRDPLERILSTAVPTYFLLFSLSLIFIFKKHILLVCTALVIYLMILMLGGGRSTMISFLIQIGFFVFFFYKGLSTGFVKRVNFFGSLSIILAISLAVVITSFLVSDVDPVFIIVNRILANADGLEYYLKYNGFDVVGSGFVNYVQSVVGIFLSPFFGPIKNVGWHLSEAASGMSMSFAQGANFILPLQVVVFPFYLGIFYILAVSFCISYFRTLIFKSPFFLPLGYYLSSSCFIIATDIEYWVFVVFSGMLLFILLSLFLLKVKT